MLIGLEHPDLTRGSAFLFQTLAHTRRPKEISVLLRCLDMLYHMCSRGGHLHDLASGQRSPRQEDHQLAQGTIARVTDRGFGFIQQEQGEDLFFHSSALQDVTFDEIRRGDVVEYETEADPRGRGYRAVNVRKVVR